MDVWRLSKDGFVRSSCTSGPLPADSVRVEVEAACLTPSDLCQTDVAPGGSCVGLVTECGKDATEHQGKRVLVSCIDACGECHVCRRGFVTVCPHRRVLGSNVDGAYAESVIVRARWLTHLDERYDIGGPKAAAVAGPVLLAYTLYTHAGVGPKDATLILGNGPVAKAAKDLATKLGAQVVQLSAAATQEEYTEALSAQDALGAPQRILLCDSGETDTEGDAPSGLAQAFKLAMPGSIIACTSPLGAGSYQEPIAKALTVVGVPFGHPDLLPETAALAHKGLIDLDALCRLGTFHAVTPKEVREAGRSGACLVVSKCIAS